ncbi:hypothetical protein [Draconibacterium sediminis]|uniref:NIPSNAP domain-containing protein n=1 Tax=Draconibacterium sediminis TaxID=1544798 RepID=A0A0D8JC18_9BACT|nr:hypothetical protein [Draconibacterium sediminis]KJF44071.1 hypothetical protein LH29_00590 [Draconibacterium sediminis]
MKNKQSSRFAGLTLFVSAVVFCTVFVFATTPAKAADQVYVVVEYFNVKPDGHLKYLEAEQKIWKPMHQERIKQGIIVSWNLYAVEFTGSADSYNYVAITTYNNPKTLENPWNAEIPAKVHPNMGLSEILDRTNKAREIVRSELYQGVAAIPSIPFADPANYIQVNYMKVEPGKGSEYEALEKDVWMPIHEESIRSGRTVGWGLWEALFPRGAGRPYQYVTMNTFSDYSYALELSFAESFKAIHPEQDFNEIMKKTNEARVIERIELWNLIDYVVK